MAEGVFFQVRDEAHTAFCLEAQAWSCIAVAGDEWVLLLEESETTPIIILQSDHGLRPCYPVDDDEWRKILNAMYLPGMDYSELSDSMSPYNTLRLIFNHYFDADYELLEDHQER